MMVSVMGTGPPELAGSHIGISGGRASGAQVEVESACGGNCGDVSKSGCAGSDGDCGDGESVDGGCDGGVVVASLK